MNITGKCMIFSSEKGYSTSISKKDQDGQYERMYIVVQLPKGDTLENKTYIDIKEGFLSFYKTKDGLPKLKLVVMKYETEQKQYEKEEDYAIDPEVELPF